MEEKRNLRIDPEFRDKIPPLTEDEFKQLRENIISDGEIYEPIVAWNGTIVDGHNRWKVHLEFPSIPLRVKDMDFADKWEAFEWMYRKQLGRRNLTEEQRAYMIGKMYESRKNTSSFKGNQYTVQSGDGQNVRNQTRRISRDGTAGEIGQEFGIDGKSVRRAEKFAKGVDAVKAFSTDAAEKILSGKSGMTKSAVQVIASLPEKQQEEIAKDIENDAFTERKPSKPQKPAEPQERTGSKIGFTKEMRDERQSVNSIYSEMLNNDDPPETTVLDVQNELIINADEFLKTIGLILDSRKSVFTGKGDKEKIANTLADISQKINKKLQEVSQKL